MRQNMAWWWGGIELYRMILHNRNKKKNSGASDLRSIERKKTENDVDAASDTHQVREGERKVDPGVVKIE